MRWFVGLQMDEAVWNPTIFTKNRDRLLDGKTSERFFQEVLMLAGERNLLSEEHFTVDGTLVEAWASLKNFKKKGKPREKGDNSGSPAVDFHGETRRNDTHASTTDPEALLYRKGRNKEARLCYAGHVLMDNRYGLAADACLTKAIGRAEREAALVLLQRERKKRKRRFTIGADRAYDTAAMVRNVRAMGIPPDFARNEHRSSLIDGRTMRHEGIDNGKILEGLSGSESVACK